MALRPHEESCGPVSVLQPSLTNRSTISAFVWTEQVSLAPSNKNYNSYNPWLTYYCQINFDFCVEVSRRQSDYVSDCSFILNYGANSQSCVAVIMIQWIPSAVRCRYICHYLRPRRSVEHSRIYKELSCECNTTIKVRVWWLASFNQQSTITSLDIASFEFVT